jgi:hypothetical protein
VDERGPDWWLDEDRQWRQGTPPPGWQQGNDGRWRPVWNAPTEVLRAVERPRHAASGPPAGSRRPVGIPMWARIGAGALTATLLVAAGLVLALGTRDDDPGGASGDGPGTAADGSISTSTTPAPSSEAPATSPTTVGSTTSSPTTVVPRGPKHGPPSTEPGPDGPTGVDPLARCSSGQRALIERGNHSPSWYAARFDPDHDGIYCE